MTETLNGTHRSPVGLGALWFLRCRTGVTKPMMGNPIMGNVLENPITAV